jgi:hypothetical protein
LRAELEHLGGGAPKEPGLLEGGLARALLADIVFRLKAAGVGGRREGHEEGEGEGEEGGTRGADGVEEAAHDPPPEAPPEPEPEPGAGSPMASAFPEAYPDVGRRRKAAFSSTHLFPVGDRRRRSKELSRLISAEASPLRRVGEVRRKGKWGRPRSGSPGKRPGRPPDYFTLDFSPVFVNPFEELEAFGFTRRERLALSRELVRRGHAEYVFECVRLLMLSALTWLTRLEEHTLPAVEEAREWWGALSWLTVEPGFLGLFRSERWIRETVESPEPTRPETAVAMCVARLVASWIRFDFNEEVGYE